MRRSRSSSNIPLPKFGRNLSSENLASSRTSQQGLRRSNSSTNLLAVPKSHLGDSRIEINKENDDIPPSTSKLASRRFTGTPLRSVGSVGRRFTATPLSQAKSMRSPGVVHLTTNKINDKKFSGDQYRKICVFLEQKMDDFEPKLLKPLTLATFVQTMSILFEEIDPRIKLTMANYKEVVFKYLKLFKYPGPVSMSLLKSVNTNLSWAQVMSIFGWLVDVINDMKEADCEDDLLDQYILGRAKNALRLGSETRGLLIENIERILDFEPTDLEILENECETLKREAEEKKILINEQKQKEIKLAEKLEQMKLDMKEFKEDNLEEKYKNEIRKLKTEFEIRELKIEEKKQFLAEKRQVVANQTYSLKDKQELLKKLEDENYSLALKREELENIYKLKCDYDYQQTDCRREIETKIHGINGRLLHLQLGSFIDDTKDIRLPDRGLHNPTYLKELEEKIELLEDINKKVESELKKVEEVFSTKQIDCNGVSDEIEEIKKNVESLRKKQQKINDEKCRVLFELDVVKKHTQKDMEEVLESAPDVDSIKRKNAELQEEVLNLTDKRDQLIEHCLNQCKELYAQTAKIASSTSAIRRALEAKAIEAAEKKLEQEAEICTLSKNAL